MQSEASISIELEEKRQISTNQRDIEDKMNDMLLTSLRQYSGILSPNRS